MTCGVVGIAAAVEGTIYALRDDGAVFVLARTGSIRPDGSTRREPEWLRCPAVPGTMAAIEQEG